MILKAGRRLRKFFNKDLTDEMIWREIIEEGRLDNIHQLTCLDAEAAFHLVKHEKRRNLLTLGIMALQPEVALALAKYGGDKLYLNGVGNLSLEAARAIARFHGAKLAFNGLKTITLPVLGRLSSFRGILHLDGAAGIEISEADSARAETVFKLLGFARLSMTGLKKPSVRLLRALAQYPGQLELNGIETLKEEEAEILAEHPGNGMVLKGIKTLALPLKKLLTHYKGVVDLSVALAIEDDILKIAALRPQGYTIFSPGVKKRIAGYKKEIPRETRPAKEEKNEAPGDKEEQAMDVDMAQKERELLEEFNRFDEMQLTVPAVQANFPEVEKPDDYEIEISEDVLDNIEINLNLKMSQKKRQVDVLLSKGVGHLSLGEKHELDGLREEIEELKEQIRAALDILVEQKELGTIIFSGSAELAAYLNASAAGDDENDALSHIEDVDLFAGCFESRDPGTVNSKGQHQAIQGKDFMIKAV